MRYVVASALAALGLAAGAQAQIGGQLFSTGGTVHIEVLPPTASFTSELWLFAPGAPQFIALNTDVGFMTDLGPFGVGDELIFGIVVRDTGDTFQMGPGSRNPDGIAHDNLIQTGPFSYFVGFEDLFGGGDLDYDDNNFQFTGQIMPAPAALPVLGLGALAMGRRRRSR